ncbi:hypothetical protein [Actinopolymorpha alba]|uniref:hypothetical protein n=1 Tax=Actinopolymorpha alba TaxID=533267 RepID=UPI00039B8F55|nr:hypothetical protein [Actinopolymorpha alba]
MTSTPPPAWRRCHHCYADIALRDGSWTALDTRTAQCAPGVQHTPLLRVREDA